MRFCDKLEIARLYFHTVRHLKLSQVCNRILRKYKTIKFYYPRTAQVDEHRVSFPIFTEHDNHLLTPDFFCVFNNKIDITSPGIWNDKNIDLLWLYNLHYFDDLSYAVRESELLNEFIQRWIDDNSIERQGVGWDPYTLSLRVVNWIKYFNKFKINNPYWNKSLLQQVLVLEQKLEFHILANHLFSNIKALVFSGLYFNGESSNRLLKKGCDLLHEQLDEQFLADGAHYELSPMYHAIMLQDVLDILQYISNSKKINDNKILDTKLRDVIIRGLRWLTLMSHPDGQISFFNDASLNNSPESSQLKDYASLFHLNVENGKRPQSVIYQVSHLNDSGYVIVANAHCYAILDIAEITPSYQPGHAHADTLSFELSLFRKRVIVNSGTSVYGVSQERGRQRSTSAHSTVMLDNVDSSETWGGFRVARRAKITQKETWEDKNEILVSAQHDGYARLRGGPLHSRSWKFTQTGLVISDKITGSGSHQIDVIFHLHPNVIISQAYDDKVVLLVDENTVEVLFSGYGKLSLSKSTYHPEFGLSVDNYKLVYHVQSDLPAEVVTCISW